MLLLMFRNESVVSLISFSSRNNNCFTSSNLFSTVSTLLFLKDQ